MLIDERVTRRSFLKGLITATAGLNSFIPLPFETLKKTSLDHDLHPYWQEVLSKGVQFFPKNIVSRYSDWTIEQMEGSAHYTLILTLGRNRKILASPGLPGDREMDEVVELNKATQHLYESLRYARTGQENEDEENHNDDTCYARLLYDDSCFILRNIMGKVEDQSFTGFSPFDLALLGSGLTFTRESIRMNEYAYDLCAEDFKEVIAANIGSGYNNLGLGLSYLGDVQQAQEAFAKALELRPDNRAILRNIQDMDANGLIVHRKLYSRIVVD